MAGAPQGYIGRNPGDGRTVINRQTSHVTTGVQTSFTMTVGYEVGFLDVYLNGIKQTETLDYTASDGSTINFSPSFAPMNGDVLEFVAFETLNITNIKSARKNFNVGQDLDVSGKTEGFHADTNILLLFGLFFNVSITSLIWSISSLAQLRHWCP